MVSHLSLWGRLQATGICSKTQENGVSGPFSASETAARKWGFVSDGTLRVEAEFRPMKINVERGAFLKALSHVQSVVERRNTIPILSNVMLEAAKGALKLTATDLDIEIVEAIPADMLRNGFATAPAHMLYDIVRKLPDGAQVQAELLTSEGGRLAVSAGSSRFELACLPQGGFPPDGGGRPAPPLPPGGRRPQAHHRQDPLRHLDRRDPLLPQRHLSSMPPRTPSRR